jgi:hypothetical protein
LLHALRSPQHLQRGRVCAGACKKVIVSTTAIWGRLKRTPNRLRSSGLKLPSMATSSMRTTTLACRLSTRDAERPIGAGRAGPGCAVGFMSWAPSRGLALWLRGRSQGWVKCEDRLPCYYKDSSCSLPLATNPRPRPHDPREPRRGRGRPGPRVRSSGALAASMQREGAVPDSFVQNKMTRASHLWTK